MNVPASVGTGEFAEFLDYPQAFLHPEEICARHRVQ